jgi:hypothetical protein
LARTVVILVLALAFGALAPVATAQVPNDDKETATVISVPLWDTVDTRTATTSALEDSWNVDHGVWYKYPAPPVDTFLTFVLYDAVEDFQEQLGEPVVAFILEDGSGWGGDVQKGTNLYAEVPAGQDAYIVVGNRRPSMFGGRPGWIQVGFVDAQPINHFGLTINGAGYVNKDGWMTVSGTVSCDTPGQAYFSVYARQKSGHGFLYGETTFQVVDCVAPSSPWSFTIFGPLAGGRFVPGKATVSAEIICPFGAACRGTFAEKTVSLKLR